MDLDELLLRTRRITKIVWNGSRVPKVTINGRQRLHTFSNTRATYSVTSVGDTISVKLDANKNGNVVYLPFAGDIINSVEISKADLPKIKLFVTAKMDGCRLLVNRMDDGSYRFHHANSQHVPTSHELATRPTFQTPQALADLTFLHDITRPAAHAHVQIRVTGTLSKADYFASVATRLARKRENGRTGIKHPDPDPQHVSWSYVIGFNKGSHWSIWYQTSSQFSYRRPAKAIFRKKVVDPVDDENIELVEAREAFRI